MTALALVALFVLVAINGFFVAAEFALVRVRREKMEAMADEGARGSRLVLRQLDAIDRYLSACQLGITMASIGIGFLGEPALAALFVAGSPAATPSGKLPPLANGIVCRLFAAPA